MVSPPNPPSDSTAEWWRLIKKVNKCDGLIEKKGPDHKDTSKLLHKRKAYLQKLGELAFQRTDATGGCHVDPEKKKKKKKKKRKEKPVAEEREQEAEAIQAIENIGDSDSEYIYEEITVGEEEEEELELDDLPKTDVLRGARYDDSLAVFDNSLSETPLADSLLLQSTAVTVSDEENSASEKQKNTGKDLGEDVQEEEEAEEDVPVQEKNLNESKQERTVEDLVEGKVEEQTPSSTTKGVPPVATKTSTEEKATVPPPPAPEEEEVDTTPQPALSSVSKRHQSKESPRDREVPTSPDQEKFSSLRTMFDSPGKGKRSFKSPNKGSTKIKEDQSPKPAVLSPAMLRKTPVSQKASALPSVDLDDESKPVILSPAMLRKSPAPRVSQVSRIASTSKCPNRSAQ